MVSTALARRFMVAPTAPRLHHLDGAPVRAAMCDATLFRPQQAGPAAAPIHALIDKRLWSVPAIYTLLWNPPSRPTPVYVGSTGDPITRLIGHDQEGWSQAIIVTGHGLTRGAALQMEYATGCVITGSRSARANLEPRWAAHPSPWQADMAWSLLEPMVVLLDLCLSELGVRANLDPATARVTTP